MRILAALLGMSLAAAGAALPADESCASPRCRAERAATGLLVQYQTRTSGQDDEMGLFGNTLPWIEANGIEAVCDYALQAGGLAALSPALRAGVEIMLVKGFNTTDGTGEHYGMGNCHTPLCGSFDDQAWWALAWVKAYELTSNKPYLNRSVEIFEYLVENSWDERACGGGAWWSSSKSYKNSITNTLFFTLAASLATVHRSEPAVAAQKEYFTDWALKSWGWMDTGGGRDLRRGGTGLFLDGLSSAQCNFSDGNDGGANATWTYNQGVVLSGLGKLYTLTGDEALLRAADAIVNAVIRHLTVPTNGTLQGPSVKPGLARVLIEPGCGNNGCKEGSDHAMFKGAAMRHLGYLRRTPGLPKEHRLRYQQFATVNADSCWWHARESTTRYQRVGSPVSAELFGNDWRGPWTEAVDSDGHPVATSEIAALSLFSSLLPDGGTTAGNPPAAGSKRKTETIGERIESVWKDTSTAVRTAVVAAVAVALVLMLGNALLAAKHRRELGLYPGDDRVYTGIAAHRQTCRTNAGWARSKDTQASETQPLLHAAHGSM